MDGAGLDDRWQTERRRRLAAEHRLAHVRRELARAQDALTLHADQVSLRYLAERETNRRLTERQERVREQRREAADRADRSRRRLWRALDTMRDGFALFDSAGRLVAANGVYLALFDAGGTLGPGCTISELLHLAAEEGAFELGADTAPEDWAAAALARWTERAEDSRLLRIFDGRVVRLRNQRAPDGDVVSVAVDVSDEQAREDALADARDEARAAARAKQDFLARMSHEIRTPMNGVLGMAEMLAEREDDPEGQSFARTIRDSAEALLAIVNDTLDVSKLEAGRVDLHLAAFDLEALLIDCVRLAEAGGARVPVLLDYPLDAPTRIVGDAGRVRQIVTNLVGNACKVTEAGHVEVAVRLGPAPPGLALTLEVRDTGPGIPAGARQHVFEPFAQVQDGRPAREGTGLGLTISRGLAERMGGTLAVVDQDAPGACLRLALTVEAAEAWPDPPEIGAVCVPADAGPLGDHLAARLARAGARVARGDAPGPCLVPLGPGGAPAAPDAGAVLIGRPGAIPEAVRASAAALLTPPVAGRALLSAIAAARAALPQAPPHVLIADDNATNRFLLEKLLGGGAWRLETVADGAQAVAAYAAQRPDLVLMDISMPQMDGFEALAAITAADAAVGRTSAPVIALTAHTGEAMATRLTEAGFAAHQTKPVRKPALVAAMRAALGMDAAEGAE